MVAFTIIFIVLVFFYDVLIRTLLIVEKANDNRRDLIVLLQLLVTSFLSLLTASMAFLTYRLQRQNNRFNAERNLETKLQKANNILYYLEDTIKKLANINFKNDELLGIFKSSREYRGDLQFLRQNLLTEDEADYIKEIFDMVDDFANYMQVDDGDRLFKIKPLYKLIIGLYIPPHEIKKSKIKGDIDYIVNLKMLFILIKLRMYLMTEYTDDVSLPKIKNLNIILELKGEDLLIRKRYDNDHYITYFKGRETGFVRKFEPMFEAKGNNQIGISYEQIYEGEIKNGVYHGHGRYDYYTKENGWQTNLNSWSLNTEGLNYDANAQLIAKALKKAGIDLNVRAYFEGEFKANQIYKGTIFYQLKPTTSFKKLVDMNKKS